jgi:hypothetical protein
MTEKSTPISSAEKSDDRGQIRVRTRAVPHRSSRRCQPLKAVRERRELVGESGVPQQIALAAVMNKIAIVGEIDRHASVYPGVTKAPGRSHAPSRNRSLEAVDLAGHHSARRADRQRRCHEQRMHHCCCREQVTPIDLLLSCRFISLLLCLTLGINSNVASLANDFSSPAIRPLSGRVSWHARLLMKRAGPRVGTGFHFEGSRKLGKKPR